MKLFIWAHLHNIYIIFSKGSMSGAKKALDMALGCAQKAMESIKQSSKVVSMDMNLFHEITTRRKDLFNAYNLVGTYYNLTGESSRALTAYSQAIDFYIRESQVNENNKQEETAQEKAKMGWQGEGMDTKLIMSEIFCARASAFLDRDEYAKSVEDSNKALLLNPSNHLVGLVRGQCSMALGNYNEAVEDFQRFLSGEEQRYLISARS